MTTKREFITTAEAAQYVRCTTSTIRKLISLGDLRAYRVGRAVRLDLAELNAYLSRR